MCGDPKRTALPTTRQQLEAALERADRVASTLCDDSKLIIGAARSHLATLPRTVMRWKVTCLDVVTQERVTYTSGWRPKSDALDSARHALDQGRLDVRVEHYEEPG